jgi:hypothetical protein
MFSWIHFPFYQKRTCENCGNKFWRIREDSIIDELKSRWNGEWIDKNKKGFVCSTGCALNVFSKCDRNEEKEKSKEKNRTK